MPPKWGIISLILIYGHVVVGQANEKSIQEASKLRDELNSKLSPEIKATPAQLKEIDAMRNEILNAVSKKEYKMSLNPILKAAVPEMGQDPIVGSPLWNRIRYSQKNLQEFVATVKPETEIPKNMKFLGKFNLNSNSYRDVIDLTEVHENLHFEFEEAVITWRTIPHAIAGNRHVLLGLTNSSLLLAKLVDGKFELLHQLEITEPGLNHDAFETFLHWNNKEGYVTGIAVLSVNNQLLWLQTGTHGNFDKLEIISSWSMRKKTTKLKYYKFKNESLLFTGDDDSGNLDIYRFSLDNNEFSLVEALRLPSPFKNIALVEWKKQLLIALPLHNKTTIYKYSERDQKFRAIKDVPSKGVTNVATFQAGGLCFFAIGGEEPKIVRYKNDGFSEIDVRRKIFQFARAFMPISIHTFRDDVLLLVQFEVQFDSHTLTRIGTLRWNGEAFEAFFNVPCYMDEALHYNGVNCLIDSDESVGLRGSVVLAHSNNVSLLVPRHNARSGLFDLKIEIRAAPHPKEEKLIDIQMMFDYFSELKRYNYLVVTNASNTIKNAVLPKKNMTVSGNWTVDVLEAQQLFPEGKLANVTGVDELKNNGTVASDGIISALGEVVKDVAVVEESASRSVIRSVEEVPEPRNNPEITQRLHVQKLRVKDIQFDTINGIPKENLLWRLEDTLPFTGSLEVSSMTVLNDFEGRINGLDLDNDLVHPGKSSIDGDVSFFELETRNLSSRGGINRGLLESISNQGNHFATLKMKELFVDEDFHVDSINDVDWRKLSQEMVRIDHPPNNLTLVVEGNVIFEDDLQISSLNGDEFTGNFVWNSEEVSVLGRKTFKSPVAVAEIDMIEGSIDGVEVNRLISLSGGSYLPDETIFTDNLELIHGLVVPNSSNIEGPYMDKFLANPTLEEERNIGASCAFRHLRVEGNVVLMGLLNNQDLNATLSEFLYRTEQPMQVFGFKEFKNLETNNVDTQLMNRKGLDAFVTLNTDQTLNLDKLTGPHFTFDYLNLGGLLDFVNFTELYEGSIRTYGDQVTEAHIIIQNPEEDHLVPNLSATARNMYIKETLNTHPPEAFLDHSNIHKYTGTIQGEDVTIDRLYLSKDIRGSPVVNGHNLDEYNVQRWSKTRVQTITSPVIVQNLINSGFEFLQMNSKGKLQLSSELDLFNGFSGDKISQYFLDELHVSSGADFEYINEMFLPTLLSNVLWLNQSNTLSNDLTFLNELKSEYNVVIGDKLNGEREFFDRVVWNDDNKDLRLKGNLLFTEGVVVEGILNTSYINRIAVENILTIDKPVIQGDLLAKRNLTVHLDMQAPSWKLTESLEAGQLPEVYQFDINSRTHLITSDKVVLRSAAVIPNLLIGRALNEIRSIEDFLNSIQRVDSSKISLKVAKTNTQELSFENLQVDFVNGENFEEFLEHAVLKSDGNKDVYGKIQFTNLVETQKLNALDISMERLNGGNASFFFEDSLLVNVPYEWKAVDLPAEQFQANEIFTQELNGIKCDKFDMKYRDQNMTGTAVIDYMVMNGHLGVKGSVNGLDSLKMEQKNTMMTFSINQIVKSRSVFNQIRVMEELYIDGFVNGHNISHVVPLNGQDIWINSPISFDSLHGGELHTDHSLNGFDFNTWYHNTVKFNDPEVQRIKGYWNLNKMTVQNEVSGIDFINGRSLKDILRNHELKRSELEKFRSDLQSSQWKLCSEIKDYFSSPLRAGCSFKHFEEGIRIKLANPKALLVFKSEDQHFLIYSEGCWSKLLLWTGQAFQELQTISSGNVVEWTFVPSSAKDAFLVARTGEQNCQDSLPNWVWTFEPEQMVLKPVKEISGGSLSDIFVSPMKRNFFYAISGSSVQEFSVPECKITNQWPLPNNSGKYRFLPSAQGSLELQLTDGQNIHTIQLKSMNRFKRHWYERSKRFGEVFKNLGSLNKTAFMELGKKAILHMKVKVGGKIVNALTQNGTGVDHSDDEFAVESKTINNVTDPSVGGAIFDDIQKRIESGADMFTDVNLDVMERLDKIYNIEELLDTVEEEMLASTKQEPEESYVGGALFDDIQETIQEGAETFVDLSEDVLETADDIVDLDELLQRTGEPLEVPRSGDQLINSIPSAALTLNDEVVALYVGAGDQVRTLFGVCGAQGSTSGVDLIRILEDLHNPRPFQTISTNNPSSLTSWNLDQETLLIFLENRRRIQIFVFRGMMGFVKYLHVDRPNVHFLRTALLPWTHCGGCLTHFLVVANPNSLELLKAETVGTCMNEIVECNGEGY